MWVVAMHASWYAPLCHLLFHCADKLLEKPLISVASVRAARAGDAELATHTASLAPFRRIPSATGSCVRSSSNGHAATQISSQTASIQGARGKTAFEGACAPLENACTAVLAVGCALAACRQRSVPFVPLYCSALSLEHPPCSALAMGAHFSLPN